ncbi:MAG: LegC family aminotransferase [Rickettsiales bacterium]|nr:LegC family aminotransferase [Rickettsiales bacterium]
MSTAIPSSPIIQAIEAVVGNAPRPIHLHEPLFIGNEEAYVSSCIRDGWVSSVGAFVDRFEQDLAKACGAKHAVVVVNGTCALHVLLAAIGVKPGDEVIVPSLTFAATANSVAHAGAIPHFVDIEETSLGIDPIALDRHLEGIVTIKNNEAINKQTGRVIRALVPVHVFGHPCQLAALQGVATKYHLTLVEDATEALGSTIGGKPVGSFGHAVLSFNGNKIITTGGGGAIVTQDSELARRLKHLTTTAKKPHAWAFEHDEIAWNYRLPNLNAALGCAQLEQLAKYVAAKRALAERYIAAFAPVKGLRILPEPKGTTSNYWLVTLLAEQGSQAWLEETLQALHDVKLLCRPVWRPLHQLPMYAHCPRADLSRTQDLAQRIISLPSSVKLGL